VCKCLNNFPPRHFAGSRIFPPRTFPPEKNANNVVEIEAGMIKQYFSSRSWNGERNLSCVAKTLEIEEISPKIDLNNPYI